MIQATLKQVRPQLTQVAGTTGMSITDPRFIERLNAAIQELMNEGDWPGVVDRWLMRYDQATGVIALPYQFDRLMHATIDHIPKTIVSPWFEFYAYGPGIQDDYDARGNRRRNWTDVITDRGDAPTQVPIPDVDDSREGPWVLRVYATVPEANGAEINIQGLDANGLIIRSIDDGTGGMSDGTAGDYYNGLNVAIDFGVPYTETTQQFSKITSVTKPETRGYVKLTAWNGVDEVELSNFAFNETEPSYRHYYIPQLHNRDQPNIRDKILLARCRKRFVPVVEDNDKLIISNVRALESMIMALWKKRSDNFKAYVQLKEDASDLLKKEATAYLGKSKIPGLTFQRGFPIGTVQHLR